MMAVGKVADFGSSFRMFQFFFVKFALPSSQKLLAALLNLLPISHRRILAFAEFRESSELSKARRV